MCAISQISEDHRRTVSVILLSVWRQCTIVSNADEKSRKASIDMLPSLRERNSSLTAFRRAF